MSSEERRKILKMIEEGIISSEEAEELLESLDKAKKTADSQLSTEVDWEKESKQKDQAKTTKRKYNLLGYVGEAFQKIKNVDLDFNFGNFFTVSHIFHHQSANFSELKVDMANGGVRIEPWKEKDVRVECEAKVYQVENQEQAREKFYYETSFRLDGELLQFSLPAQQIKAVITIKIPDQYYKKINCKLFNGNIYVERLRSEQFIGKTTNGTIILEETTGIYLDVETANGMIKMEEGNWKQADLETINGRIEVNGRFEKLESQSVSGSIYCNWEEGSNGHTAHFKTTTGSVRIRLPEDLQTTGQLETKVGGIHYSPKAIQVVNEKKDKMNKVLHFKANDTKESIFFLEAEAKTGSIWLLSSEEE